MSYHQKTYSCSRCGLRDRGVEYQPLLGDFLHYECWLEIASEHIGTAKRRVDADRFISDPLVDPLPDHPFQGTREEWKKTSELDLFGED